MTIGIAMANKNYGAWLQESIESIRGQTFEDWKLIIIDYGSSDGSLRVYPRYNGEPRIDIIKTRTRSPLIPLEAHNLAFRHFYLDPEIEFVMKFDPDDVMDPGFLRRHMRALDRSPEAVAAFTDFYYMTHAGKRYEKGFRLSAWAEKIPEECLIPETALIRRSTLDEQNLWFFDWERLGIMAVFDRYLRIISERGLRSFRYLPDELFGYRQHAGQLSQIPHVQQFAQERATVTRDFYERVRKKMGE